jgi:hypothetical protein
MDVARVVVGGEVLVEATVTAGARVVVGAAVVADVVVVGAGEVVVTAGALVLAVLLQAEATSSKAKTTGHFFTV